MVAKILILAFSIVWKANSQKYGGSIFINPLRPPLAEESQIFVNPLRPPCAEESPIFPDPLRPRLTEESPIYVNPLRPSYTEESPKCINPIRPTFASKPSSTKSSPKKPKTLPVSVGKPSSEKKTPRIKAPSFPVTCKSSEPLSPLSVKTSLSNTPADSISDCELSLPSNCDQNIIPVSSKKPIKFYGPRVNIEVTNIPLILPQPEVNCAINTKMAPLCESSSNLIVNEPSPLTFSQEAVSNLLSPNPVTLINKRPVTNIIPTTRSLKYILNSLNNSPSCETAQSSVSSESNVAKSSTSISSSLGQSSTTASAINTNSNRPEQVYHSPYSSNILGCPENDPFCSYTSVPSITAAPCIQSSVNNADASISSNPVSSSSAQVSSNLVSSYQPSNSMQASSLASSCIEFNQNSAPYSENILGCPDTDPTCSHTSIIPLSNAPFYQSSVNTEASGSLPSNLVSSSSASSLSQIGLNLANTFSSSNQPLGYMQTSSLASSGVEFNSNSANSQSSNIFDCPYTDPTCSHTSIIPLSNAPCYQSSVNADASGSLSSNLVSSSSASPLSQISSNLANTFSPSHQPSGYMQTSSLASSGIEFNPNSASYSSNIFGCPETDPFCSYTSVSPTTAATSDQSSHKNADALSSIPSNLASSSSASSFNQISLNTENTFSPPDQISNLQASFQASSAVEFNPKSATPYSSNILGCPETDPFCSYTSIPPVTAELCHQSSVYNADVSSSTSSSLVTSTMSLNSDQFSPYLTNPYLINTAPLSQSSDFVKTSSLALSGNDFFSNQRSPYPSNVLGCPETDPTCSHTSIVPLSNAPCYESSNNISDVSSSTSSNLVSSSTASSFRSGPVSPNFVSPYLPNSAQVSQSSGFIKASSTASSIEQVNQNLPAPYSSNILGCPDTDPTCSHTSIAPITDGSCCQSSNKIADSSSSISSDRVSSSSPYFQVGLDLANPYLLKRAPASQPSDFTQASTLTSSAASKQYLPSPYSQNVGSVLTTPSQSSVNVAEATSSSSSNFGQTSSASSSNVNSFNVVSTSQSPYTLNILGCPEIDPTCSFTSVPPVSSAPSYQSSINIAKSSSSISSGLGSSSSSSFGAYQISSNSENPYQNVLSICETDPFCCDTSLISSNPDLQPSVTAVETSSSVPSGLAQASSSLSSPIDVNPIIISQEILNLTSFSSNIVPLSISSASQSSVNSVEATNSDFTGSVQATAVSTTAASSPIVATEAHTISSLAVTDSTSNPSTTNIASSSANLVSISDISTSSLPVSKTATATSSVTASEAMIAPSNAETLPPIQQNNISPVVETMATSSATSSSSANVVSTTSLVSSTTTDTTNVLEQSAPVQSTTTSTSSSSSISTTNVPIPTSFPTTCSPSFAVALSNPVQNLFNLEINPLILEVEIPSSIRSSIVSANSGRSYGPHQLKIPACIPTRLSCALRPY